MSAGPYLYDDQPMSPHTGTPRTRNGLLVALLVVTVLVGVVMAITLPVVKGSAEEQSTAAVTVFYDSLADGDIGTAMQMLCESERERLDEAGLVAEYPRAGEAEVTGSRRAEDDPDRAQQVTLRWSDGGTSTLRVINEDGPRVCGTGAEN